MEDTRYTGTLMPRELDPEMATLEDIDESNGPYILYSEGDWCVSDGLIYDGWRSPLK